MDVAKKCMISRYDETITEPPYLTNQIDEITVDQPEEDHLGEIFAERLKNGCFSKGYLFRFYTTAKMDGYDYNIVVY